jgi:hypothetical protein
MNTTFLALLGLLFIALKLAGYISWSWWLVTAPLWVPAIFAVVFLFIVFIMAVSKGVL